MMVVGAVVAVIVTATDVVTGLVDVRRHRRNSLKLGELDTKLGFHCCFQACRGAGQDHGTAGLCPN